MLKKRYIAVLLIKEHNDYTIIGKKVFNPTNKSIKFRNNTYILNLGKRTFSKGLKQFYYVDITNKTKTKQLVFIKPNENTEVDTEVIDMIISKKIIKQLTSELGITDYKQIIFYVVIGLTIGGLIGYLVGRSLLGA